MTNRPRNVIKPPREEWDFRPPMLPDNEVMLCLQYESGRLAQSQSWRDEIEIFRQNCSGNTYEAYLERANYCEEHLKPEQWPRLFYTIWPEWPTEPYLKIPQQERRKRIADWFTAPDEPLETVSIEELFSVYDRLKFTSDDPEIMKIFKMSTAHIRPLGATIKDSMNETVAFRIGHWETEAELVQRFQLWLKSRRTNEDKPAKETRGGASFIKQARANLCTLGAFRLLSSGLNSTQAYVYTSTISGKGLFSNFPSAWSRALEKARSEWPVQVTSVFPFPKRRKKPVRKKAAIETQVSGNVDLK